MDILNVAVDELRGRENCEPVLCWVTSPPRRLSMSNASSTSSCFREKQSRYSRNSYTERPLHTKRHIFVRYAISRFTRFVRYTRFRCMRQFSVRYTKQAFDCFLYRTCLVPIPEILSGRWDCGVWNVQYTKQAFGCFAYRTSGVGTASYHKQNFNSEWKLVITTQQ